MTSISDKVILVTVEFKGTTGNKVDRNISQEVAETKSANQKELGNFTKKLFGKFPELEQINKFDALQRKEIEKMTVPFSRNQHLLPSEKLMEYYALLRDIKTNRAKLVQNMVDAIPDRIEAIKSGQGTGFDASMLPTPEDMASRFSIDHFESMLPEKSNFEKLIGVEDLINELQEEFDQKMEDKMSHIETYLKGMLRERLETVRTRLYNHNSDSRKIQQRVIDRTVELANRVKQLNVTSVESVNENADSTIELLDGLNSDVLSTIESIRSETIQSLDLIIAKL